MTRCAVALSLLLALAAPSGTRSQAPPPPADGFDVKVLPVRVDPELDLWTHVPEDVAPNFAVADSVVPGETIMILVFLNHIGDDGQGQGRVTLDITQYEADDEIGFEQAGIEAWSGKLPPKHLIVLARATLGLVFDEDEQRGEVSVTVVAHDEASGADIERGFDLLLTAWSYGEKPASQEEFTTWLEDYHRLPRPGEAVRAFLEYADLTQKGDWNYASVGFFRSLFGTSPWLVDHLIATARGSAEDRVHRTATLLHFMGQDERLTELYADAAEAADAREALARLTLPDPYASLEVAGQLDLLWGEFFATGRYRPIRQIVRALDVLEDKDPVATWKASPQGAEDSARLMQGLAALSALWSLGSNMEQHSLVAHYGRWMLDREELTSKERGLLAASLKRAHEKSLEPESPR